MSNPLMDPLHEARKSVAILAKQKWMDEVETPHRPFGFTFLGWSIEVHPQLIIGEPCAVKLRCYRVKRNGTLEDFVEVRI